jgi:hypothetical protein
MSEFETGPEGSAEEQLIDTDMLDTLADFVRRYVVLTPAQATVIALWIVHTHGRRLHALPCDHIRREAKRQDPPPRGAPAAGGALVVHRSRHCGRARAEG